MEIVLIGHIVNDTIPKPHIGGGVVYSSIAAKRLLGKEGEVKIVTKCFPNHPYIDKLKNLGIQVYNLSSDAKITTFENFYDKEGNRKQRVLETQEKITLNDYANFSSVIDEGSLVIVAPVIGEVDPSLFPLLAQKGILAVTPQGYFREVGKDGIVSRKPWKDVEALRNSNAVVLSDEDLTFDDYFDKEVFKGIIKESNIVVMTEGMNGSSIYRGGKKEFHAGIFKLEEDELNDFTGAGDTYAASFLINYQKIGNLREAASFASLVSAIKVDGEKEKTGIETIPTLEKIINFVNNRRERYFRFKKENQIPSISFIEGGSMGEGNQSRIKNERG